MITLTASAITKLVTKEARPRKIRIYTDSVATSRIGKSEQVLEVANGGTLLTSAESILVNLASGEEIFIVSSGAPTISWSEEDINGGLILS